MSSINCVILTGNVGQDPKITILDNGVKIANFSLATNKTYKNKAGEKVEQNDWHRIVMFNGSAEIAEKYVKKGSKIAIQGELRSRTYEDKFGEKRTIVEIYAEQLQLLSSSHSGAANNNIAEQQAENASDFMSGGAPTDDLPF